MRFDIHEVAEDGDLVVLHSTLSARHTGPFLTYDDAGAVSQVMPPTGRTFSATQTHWFRHADGKVIEHWANRDDLTMARQAGWGSAQPPVSGSHGPREAAGAGRGGVARERR